uniref:Uncharacterized protein n=1 Tax=Yoonia rhodophyticola TaxID=3137370 RepID=A0AAN0NLB4_9RHOB
MISGLAAAAVGGGLNALRFSVNASLSSGPAGPYRLEIVARLGSSGNGGGGGRIGSLSVPGRNPVRTRMDLRSRAARSAAISPVGGLTDAGRVLRRDIDIPDIAALRGPPEGVGTDELAIWRHATGRTALGFTVATAADIGVVTVRLLHRTDAWPARA